MSRYIPPHLKNRDKNNESIAKPVLNSVVAVIIRKKKQKAANVLIHEVLLQRRGMTMRFDPGKIECPGGRIDRDELPEHACLREIGEECGDGIRAALTGFTHVMTVSKDLWEDLAPTGGVVHIYYAEIDYNQSLKIKPKAHNRFRNEASEHMWVPLDTIPAMNQNAECGEFSGYLSHIIEFWKAANAPVDMREDAINTAKDKAKRLKLERATHAIAKLH